MVNYSYLMLSGVFAAAAMAANTCTCPGDNGGSPQTFYIRTDLQANITGQSPEFKDNYLGHESLGDGSYEITSLQNNQKSSADGGFVFAGLQIALNTASNGTLNVNLRRDDSNPMGIQPITLTSDSDSEGTFWTDPSSGELKANIQSAQWNTWLVCPQNGVPQLFWLAQVTTIINKVSTVLVSLPTDCSAVRLYVEDS
ncbi:hypothetical protein MMC09_004533 [Bachmanniomyces sp. S44760]|nr:hypothetical protein [Bachmanniomyces sp. S44760]